MLHNLIYIFQSEHYNRLRFLRFVYTHRNWFQLSKRGSIDWTIRAIALFILTALFFLIILYYVIQSKIGAIPTFFIIMLTIVSTPLLLFVADIILSPIIQFRKKRIFHTVQKYLEHVRKTKEKNNNMFLTIGITGSYGKTTIKTILHSLLSQKYTIFLIPGNINTDLGIANYILRHKTEVEKSDIILLEMGAFHRGEIASICSFIPPDYSFLTAIGNQHLERFGSHENIKKTKFEIVAATRKKAFLNTSDPTIAAYIPFFIRENKADLPPQLEITEINTKEYHNTSSIIRNITYLDDFQGIQFEYKYNNTFLTLQTKLIANHIISSLYFCLPISEELQLSNEDIITGVHNIPQIPHRLEIIKNTQTGVTIIDDSYNGNFDGFVSGLKTLARAKGRKIVLTPGLVELGEEAQKIHETVAQLYPQYIDVLLLILNSNTQYIRDYVQNNTALKVISYENVNMAHADLANILKKGDTILFQNDLSDNY